MNLLSRALGVAALFLLTAHPAAAQQSAPAPVWAPPSPEELPESLQQGEDNWFYEGSDLEQEKAWLLGELDNGLRYAVRRHGVPQGLVSFRALVDAGALHEQDSEQGYAHLLEHLLFRESKYLGPNEAFSTWQRMGAQIGIDTNATTSPTQTVYRIDLPNASINSVSETLRLLSGMLEAPVLSDANVRSEIPIVLAEKRDGESAQRRVFERKREIYYAGQLLARRATIGTPETLNAADGASVTRFHRRWYRPENTVLVVVGDVDPLTVVREIEQYYADWEGQGETIAAPSFGDPAAPPDATAAAGLLPPLGAVEALVEPDLAPHLGWVILRPWRQVLDTKEYNRGWMREAIAQALLNRRLEARARAGAYLYATVDRADVSRTADATSIAIGPLDGDWQGALAEVRGIMEDAIATPPTQEEIDREAAELDVSFQDYYDKRNLRPSSELADDFVDAIDIRETVTSPGAIQRVFESARPSFTPAIIHQATRELFRGTVGKAVLVTNAAGSADEAALALALTREVAPDTGARLAAAEIDVAELPPIGTPQQADIASIGIYEIERLDWDNGVSALLWPTDDEPGRVLVRVRFGAGHRAFSAADAAYATLGEMALVASGQAGLDNEALDRLTNGRKIAFDFTIEDGRFAFAAETRREDLTDQLYLLAAKFAYPRWDEGPVRRARAAAMQGYRSYATSAAGVLERDLEWLLRAEDPRFRTPDPAAIQATSEARFAEIWGDILASGPIEVQVFGDFDRAAGIAALNRSFGALPARGALPANTQSATVPVTRARAAPITVTHRGADDQAMAVVAWNTGGGIADYPTARKFEAVSMLYTNRLLDTLRERRGVSYTPQMLSQWPTGTENGGRLFAIAQVKPEDVPVIFDELDAISRDLAENGPTPDELAKVTEPLRQLMRRASSGSAFYMWQLEDATLDPRRFDQIDTLYQDFALVTGTEVKELVRKYLMPADAIRIAILPDG